MPFFLADLRRGFIVVALEDPLFTIDVLKFDQSLSQFLDRGKGFHPQQILLEQSDETFGTAVTLRLANEGGR